MSVPSETPRRPTPQAVISPLPTELRRRIISTQNHPQNAQIGVSASGQATPSIRPINQPSNSPFQSRVINPAAVGFRK